MNIAPATYYIARHPLAARHTVGGQRIMRRVVTRQPGFSLMELVVTTSMMAVLMTAAVSLLRTSQNAWQVADSGQVKIDAANATLRHLIRELRQGERITAITPPGNTAGALSVRMPDGTILNWALNGTAAEFKKDAGAWSVLAQGIDEMIFEGYKLDGVTPTVVPDDVQVVHCIVRVGVFGETHTISSSVWLRVWQ